jgi:hypothetical protein
LPSKVGIPETATSTCDPSRATSFSSIDETGSQNNSRMQSFTAV